MGAPSPHRRRTWRITGQVQGVGFRPFVYRVALDLGVRGHVLNDARGVTLVGEAPPATLDALARRVRDEAPGLARVDEIRVLEDHPIPRRDATFRIAASDPTHQERGRVTVDAAVCAACLEELFDPANRRYHHGLINCTHCGPRYTIVKDLPYDRPLTTMAPFRMCPACEAEYLDPLDRRFHAQPTCCPVCGPPLRFLDPAGNPLPGDPLDGAARIVEAGGLLAMKGLGGYHLVCDGTNEAAVAALRRGKHRDEKPFALMVEDVETAERLVTLRPAALDALLSPERPIVLARRRDASGDLAPSVAPSSHRLGIMLPTTPMQHLLLRRTGRPLVMTSANESDDPLVTDDEEARQRLGTFVDAFWTHARDIERAIDDSIVLDAPWGILPLRRARGTVPTPLRLPIPAAAPGVAVGGELKNTVAVVRGREIVLGQHLGDLKYSLAYDRFVRTLQDLERLFDVRPRWIACDRHPDYLSSVLARRRAAEEGLALIEVQHHHAHLAAGLAERGRQGPAIGLICDGAGWGDDGTLWGCEILVGDCRQVERVGRLRPLRLPGGDAAARITGRPALAWLFDLLGKDAIHHPAAARCLPDPRARRRVATLLEKNVRCVPSSGLGRLFDATAALLGVCLENKFEAMSGMRLETLASNGTKGPPGDGLIEVGERDGLIELDPRPLLVRLLEDMERGVPVADTSWCFHDALADALARGAVAARARWGLDTVVLAGGVFLNTHLTARLMARLETHDFEVLTARSIPPNDGSIAFGQAAVAAARGADLMRTS